MVTFWTVVAGSAFAGAVCYVALFDDVLIARAVYGRRSWRRLSAQQLDRFFVPSTVQAYEQSGITQYGINGAPGLPSIANGAGVLCRWHITHHGRVPRWSPWSKRLDAIYRAGRAKDL